MILGTFGTLVGSDPAAVLAEVSRIDSGYDSILEGLRSLPTPYGDGTASEKILDTLRSRFSA